VIVGGAIGAVVVGAVAVIWAASDDSPPASWKTAFESVSTPDDDQESAAQRRCISDTVESADRLFSLAGDASAADLNSASLNRDGDSAWQAFAGDLQSLDLSGCPPDFQQAMIEYSRAWREFGDAWLDVTDGLVKSTLSAKERQTHELRVNQARSLLESVAEDHGVALPARTFDF